MNNPEVEPRLSAEQISMRRWNELDYGANLVEQNPAIHDAERQVDALLTPAPESNVHYGNFQIAELAEKDDMLTQARKDAERYAA